jgi:hypothetical protein
MSMNDPYAVVRDPNARPKRIIPPKYTLRDNVSAGTLGSVIRQLKLSTKQFHRFMDCSMTSNEYFEILDSSRSE